MSSIQKTSSKPSTGKPESKPTEKKSDAKTAPAASTERASKSAPNRGATIAKDSYQKATPPASSATKASAPQTANKTTLAAPAPPSSSLPTSKLAPKDQKTLEEIQKGANGADAKANLEKLTSSSAYKNLTEPNQAKALEVYLAHPTSPTAAKNLQRMLESPSFSKLPEKEQGQTFDVLRNTNASGQKALIDLVERQIGTPPQSALLNTDSKGNTLVSSLQSMATSPLAAELEKGGIKKDNLLETTIREMATPGQINQNNHNTCTVTSMQYMLCTQNPAEFARIMSGLTSPEGKVELRNGDTLTRVQDSISFDKSTDRSSSERLFQAAMMDYSNAQDVYSNPTDQSTRPDNTSYAGGLQLAQVEHGLSGLFGKPFETLKSDGRKQALLDLLTKRSGEQTVIGLKWGSGGHAVVAEKIENGRVYFRNPWGPKNDPNGTTYTRPERKLEDNTTGLESMTVEEFKNSILVAYPPK